MIIKKSAKLSSIALIVITMHVYADQPPPMNYPQNQNSAPPSYQPQVVQQCPPANQNNIYDPRVPPAGVYRSSDSTIYTTGEKKPYLTDNGCNTNPQAQPYVYTQSPSPPTPLR